MRLPWRHALCDNNRCQFWKATSWNMIESYWMIWNFCRSLSVIFCHPDDRVEPECLHCGCLSGLTVRLQGLRLFFGKYTSRWDFDPPIGIIRNSQISSYWEGNSGPAMCKKDRNYANPRGASEYPATLSRWILLSHGGSSLAFEFRADNCNLGCIGDVSRGHPFAIAFSYFLYTSPCECNMEPEILFVERKNIKASPIPRSKAYVTSHLGYAVVSCTIVLLESLDTSKVSLKTACKSLLKQLAVARGCWFHREMQLGCRDGRNQSWRKDDFDNDEYKDSVRLEKNWTAKGVVCVCVYGDFRVLSCFTNYVRSFNR